MTPVLSGGCNCGAVRFEVGGRLAMRKRSVASVARTSSLATAGQGRCPRPLVLQKGRLEGDGRRYSPAAAGQNGYRRTRACAATVLAASGCSRRIASMRS